MPEASAASDQAPAAAAPADTAKPSLEDSLASLDDETRQFVLGEVRGARTEAKKLRDRVAALEPKATQFEQLAAASQTETEKQAAELARWQGEAERWRTTSVTSRIEALAAPDFAYPTDAVGKLDPAKYLDAGGVIDETAIKADLNALLAERPTWARTADAGASRVPAPNRSQGTSANGPAPSSPRDQFAAAMGQMLT